MLHLVQQGVWHRGKDQLTGEPEGVESLAAVVCVPAAQNYYRSYDWFSPMVLFGTDYWSRQFPVEQVLRALFNEQDEAWLTVTDDIETAAQAIISFEPPDHRELD